MCVGETDEYRRAREAVRNQPKYFFNYAGAAETILREIQEIVDKWPDFDGGIVISDKIKAYFEK